MHGFGEVVPVAVWAAIERHWEDVGSIVGGEAHRERQMQCAWRGFDVADAF